MKKVLSIVLALAPLRNPVLSALNPLQNPSLPRLPRKALPRKRPRSASLHRLLPTGGAQALHITLSSAAKS